MRVVKSAKRRNSPSVRHIGSETVAMVTEKIDSSLAATACSLLGSSVPISEERGKLRDARSVRDLAGVKCCTFGLK
ncbi:hypothetical protein RRG08_009845 [Elysia crispata]|uniref:Uncharacterized protein n=1 Tax=Elysia crispata TaxID=231223 RepID=A0AAE0Z467_9GAST|nr:hypothetical protein RRG08_009845 [Elysia crispata]